MAMTDNIEKSSVRQMIANRLEEIGMTEEELWHALPGIDWITAGSLTNSCGHYFNAKTALAFEYAIGLDAEALLRQAMEESLQFELGQLKFHRETDYKYIPWFKNTERE